MHEADLSDTQLDQLLDVIDAAAIGTDAKRIVHGRGRSLGGLEFINIDWLAPVWFVTLYRPLSGEILQRIVEHLGTRSSQSTVVVQVRRGRATTAQVLHGSLPEAHTISEDGLRYRVDLTHHQNIGFFLDMRPGRRWLRANCAGASVLNLFSYTCAFSVTALDGDARHVVNIDMSKTALKWGRDNHVLNGQDKRRVTFLSHNIFRSWNRLKALGPYDVAIIDPPSRQRGSFDTERDYGTVLARLPKMMSPGSRALLCLNSPYLGRDFLTGHFAKRCPAGRVVRWIERDPDFPDANPDQALKLLEVAF